jgi:hypothetical protein
MNEFGKTVNASRVLSITGARNLTRRIGRGASRLDESCSRFLCIFFVRDALNLLYLFKRCRRLQVPVVRAWERGRRRFPSG